MRDMRESGVEWLGKIPKHWSITRIKTLFELRNERNYEALEYVNLISLYTDKGVVQHRDLEKTTGNKAVTADGYKIVKKDDIVVNIILCWMGAVGRSDYDGVTSPAYDIYKPNVDTNSRYYHYLFRTPQFNGECYRYGRGIMLMRWRTYSTEFRAISIPQPPVGEQKKIVEFLDAKMVQIDTLIANVQSQIEKLISYKQSIITEAVTKGLNTTVPMRDSGVNWIGRIPMHWDIINIGRITTKVGSGKTPSGGSESYANKGVLFLRSQNIYDTGLVLDEPTYISDEIDADMKNTRVAPYDVLLNITGGSIGRCCVFYPEFGRANVNQHVCIIRAKNDLVIPEYMHYYWMSKLGHTAIAIYQTGGNREGMSADRPINLHQTSQD